MKENLQKYWFVVLVALALVFGIIYYTVTSAKNTELATVKGKSIDGADVVYSFNGNNVFADEFFDQLNGIYGRDIEGIYFTKEVVGQFVETTDEMKDSAAEQAEQTVTYFTQQYGDTADTVLASQLEQIGFSGDDALNDYYINSLKTNKVLEDFITINEKEAYDNYVAEKKPRTVSHILVTMEDPENPTEEEAAKLQQVKDALANGTSFEEAAYQFSDDSTAQQYGSLGFVDADTQFVESFLQTALNTEAGQTSEWTESEYGWHLIKVNSTDLADFISDQTFNTNFTAFDSNLTYNLSTEALLNAANSLDIEYANDDVKANIDAYLGIGESN